DELVSSNGTIYIRNKDKILEISFLEHANGLTVGARVAAHVLENACHLYQGVAIQNLLGEPQACLFPKPGICRQVKLPELKKHKVVEAKFDDGVLMVIASERGKYHRFVYRFDS